MAKNCPNFDRHYHHHHCNYLYAASCNDMEVDGELTFSRNFTKFAQLPNNCPTGGNNCPTLGWPGMPGRPHVRLQLRNCRKCSWPGAQVARMGKGWKLEFEDWKLPAGTSSHPHTLRMKSVQKSFVSGYFGTAPLTILNPYFGTSRPNTEVNRVKIQTAQMCQTKI